MELRMRWAPSIVPTVTTSLAADDISASLEGFIERYAGPDRQLPLRLF
jgi:hypothetical protein